MKTNSNYTTPEMTEIPLDSCDILCMSAQDVTVVEGWEWTDAI